MIPFIEALKVKHELYNRKQRNQGNTFFPFQRFLGEIDDGYLTSTAKLIITSNEL